jgi:hypothetical protein
VWDDASLRIEVLEQFCAPEWFDLPLQDALLSKTMYSDVRAASDKSDDLETDRILEAAAARLCWVPYDLASAAGLPGAKQAVGVQVALALQKAGWVMSGQSNKPGAMWLNVAGIFEWWAGRFRPVHLRAAQDETGVPPNTMKRFARASGWAPNTKSVWRLSSGRVSALVES